MTKNILTRKWLNFILAALFYLLWVIWLGNYWWLIGLAVIFDIYISKKVHWAFWKRRIRPAENRRNLWSGLMQSFSQ